ncbi:MAG: alpha/beta hydrolase family protein [Kordiimonas sp.]
MKHIIQCLVLSSFASIMSATVSASPATSDPLDIDRTSPPGLIELTIPSAGAEMVGHMYTANGPGPHPTVIFLHGFPGNEKNLDVAQALRRTGFNTLYFHYRGAWGSAGDYTLHNVTEDAAAAVTFVRENASAMKIDPTKISFFGHSLGGFNAIYSGAKDKSITCTVAVAPADFTAAISNPKEDAAEIAIGGASVPGLKDYSMADLFKEVGTNPTFFRLPPYMNSFSGRPLMVISGDKDRVISLASQQPIVDVAKLAGATPLKHVIIDADHSFSWRRIELAETTVTWMKKHCM